MKEIQIYVYVNQSQHQRHELKLSTNLKWLIFFKILDETIINEQINPKKICNADESALSTVQRPQKIFATSGRKQVGSLTSAERGSHTTVVCCMGTDGSYVPPCLIFARKNMKNKLLNHAPPGTLGIAQERGWMTGPVF